MVNTPSAMERQEEILLTGCQDEFPQEILTRCREFLSTHTLDGDDPLEVWYQYIRWAEEHFPESGRRENIQKLLHTCLDKFHSSEEYFQDVRFIKLWLKYAEMAENPLQIYNQLSMCGVGVQSALLYKSWADELFRHGDFKKADKVFREGLKRKAQPLDKLRSAYGNFHVAVARRILDETKVHTGSGADKWTDSNTVSGRRKHDSLSEFCTGEPQLITSGVLKPVENLPSRFAAKCPKAIEKAVNGKSTGKNGTQIERLERDTKKVSTAQRYGKYPTVHGPKVGNSRDDYKANATDGFHCRVAVFEVPNPTQRPMYPKERVYADNTEYSLEELRAASYIRKETNTERGNHSHPVMEICNKMPSCETQRSPLASPVDKKLAEVQSLGNKRLHPLHRTEENFSLFKATGDDIWPAGNIRCRNEKIEYQHSTLAHQPSLTNTSTKLALSKSTPNEILTAVPLISVKENSAVSGSGNTYSNQHHEKENALLAGERNISQFTTNHCDLPRANYLLDDAEPDLSDAKETISSASTRNITLRVRNDSRVAKKQQVRPSDHINNDGVRTAVQTSTLPHNAEIICEPGHYTSEYEDLKENMEDNNGLCSVSHPVKYEIPFVPSPGMTSEEIEQLKGTENKENEGGMPKNLNKCEMLPPAEPVVRDHLTQRTSSQPHATGFGIVDAMYIDKDVFELQPRQSAFFSDTCSSQMFAHTLLSSTPARKSIFHLANTHRTKSIENLPVHARTSEEINRRNIVGEIQHEADQLPFSPHTANSESKELLNPANVPTLHQSHTYRDVKDEINPFDDVLISQLLHYSGFVEKNKGDWLKVLRKPTPRIRLPFTLKIDNDTYQVIKEIGKGSYARILCATDNDGERVALKVQKPSWLWEAYIEDQIQHRIKGKNMGLCFANPSRVYEYSDGSIMVHEYLKYGSILNFITEVKKVNRAVNENVIFCFMCKIIEAIRGLHNCEIIHGDLKPDNIMIRSVYPPSVQLIDFGRAIDMTLFPPKTTFTYAVTTKDFQCTEMQARKPWTYQTDIFGLLSTAHCFLFGEYMKVSNKSGKWAIQKSLPRSCHKQLWSQFFHDLLNIESCDKLPDLSYWEAAMQQEIDITALNDQLKVIKNAMDGY